jgi:phosphoglycolate phosphatase-like HAD superfamily hydrolase
MLAGILFDLDGTLIDFKIDYKRARAETVNVLESHGLPHGRLTSEMLVLAMLQDAEKYFKDILRYSERKIKAIKKEVNNKVELVERDAAMQATPLSGIPDVLNFVLAEKIVPAVITYNSTANALLSLETAGLLHYFANHELIIGRDMVSRPKPDPEHTYLLLKRLGMSPNDICIIGDHPRDIEAALNVHARAIAIRDEKHAREEYETPYCIEKHEVAEKLPKILRQFME